jgi:hypothetical protein
MLDLATGIITLCLWNAGNGRWIFMCYMHRMLGRTRHKVRSCRCESCFRSKTWLVFKKCWMQIPCKTLTILKWRFRGLFLNVNSSTVPQLGYDHALPYFSQFIIHQLSCHSTLMCVVILYITSNCVWTMYYRFCQHNSCISWTNLYNSHSKKIST